MMRRAFLLPLTGCLVFLAVVAARAKDTPPTTAPVAAPIAAPPAKPAPIVQTMPPKATVAILGKPVVDTTNKQIARVIDVLIDASGEPQAAVLDFGGFMGVGARKIAVHWAALHFDPEADHPVRLELTPDQIKAVPEYRGTSKPAPVVTPARVTAPLAETPPKVEAVPSAKPGAVAAAPPPATPGANTPAQRAGPPSATHPPAPSTPAPEAAPHAVTPPPQTPEPIPTCSPSAAALPGNTQAPAACAPHANQSSPVAPSPGASPPKN